MTWLLEERVGALPVILIGVISVVLLGAGWAKTGRKEVLYGLIAIIFLCALVLGLQRFVVTDGEKVLATLHQIANDVERNDLEAVLKHIHSQSPRIRAEAESEFPRYRFKEVKITRIREVISEPKHVPPQVIVQFSVVVTGTDADGTIGEQPVPRYVEATFHKDDDGVWRVHHYEHFPPQQSIMK
jgi:hypothetical protein